MTFEVCVDNYYTAVAAANFPIQRIELCSAIAIGGLSPSISLLEALSSLKGPELHVMIRPRGGDFQYLDKEIEMMEQEILHFSNYKVKGVVLGCLDAQNDLDVDALKRLTQTAHQHNLEMTFHRAFDFVLDPEAAIEMVIDLGFKRILTSGFKSSALEGRYNLEKLVQRADGRIEIMAGGGINASNALAIAETGVDALHFSGQKVKEGAQLGMGESVVVDEGKIKGILDLFL